MPDQVDANNAPPRTGPDTVRQGPPHRRRRHSGRKMSSGLTTKGDPDATSIRKDSDLRVGLVYHRLANVLLELGDRLNEIRDHVI